MEVEGEKFFVGKAVSFLTFVCRTYCEFVPSTRCGVANVQPFSSEVCEQNFDLSFHNVLSPVRKTEGSS